MNTISNEGLSDPLCDSVNRGLTLVRLDPYTAFKKLLKVCKRPLLPKKKTLQRINKAPHCPKKLLEAWLKNPQP